jgi:hypothetical protein
MMYKLLYRNPVRNLHTLVPAEDDTDINAFPLSMRRKIG